MNNQDLEDIGHPDPEWEYYPLWHSCQHVKARIEKVLKIMGEAEYANHDLDKKLRKMLDSTSNKLIEMVNQFPEDEE